MPTQTLTTDARLVYDSGMTPAAGTRVIGYARVSTDDQDLAAQEQAIRAEAERRGWDLIDVVHDVASGKSTKKRPGLERCMAGLDAGFAQALVVAKLDRLSRSLIDFGEMLEHVRKAGWSIVVLDMELDTTTAVGRMTANTLMNFAQFERELIGQRTREGLAAKKAAGTLKGPLGRQSTLDSRTVVRITREREAGASLRGIATGLNRDGVKTGQGGKQWHASTVKAVLARVGS